MITTIVFDIGGVFFHEPKDRKSEFWRTVGLADPAVADQVMHGGQLWDIYKRGGMSEEAYWTGLIQELPIDYPHSWETLCAEFENSVVLETELVVLAKQLKERYRIHVLSNAGVELERRLQYFEIADLFGEVINSHYVKMAKPDEAIYELTCEVVGAKPEEILFVDDKSRNTVVADAMGYHTHIYTTAESFAKFLEEASLLGNVTL